MSEDDRRRSECNTVTRQFDYKHALAPASDEVLRLLGKGACELIERCVGKIVSANKSGLLGDVNRHACSLSIMAGYLGATPIERLAHDIERLLPDTHADVVESRLLELQAEVDRLLPALREKLDTVRA